jgi:hypothetical protein
VVLAAAAAVGCGLWLGQPALMWYLGYSGVLHGMLAAGLILQWMRERSPASLAIAAVLVAKLLFEHLVGPLPFAAATGDLPVVFAAHSYGALGGVLAGGVACALRARSQRGQWPR